jgi:hypothetical protein
MPTDFRHFEAGPDPFGRTWNVEFVWLQTAISIRHADAVDVKFRLASGDTQVEKVVSLRHPDLLKLSEQAGRPITDPWCSKLAALHVKYMIETGEDIEKTLVTAPPNDLERHSAALEL